MTIDPSLIQPADAKNLANSFLTAIKRFYEDPKNEKKFQDWKKQRNEHKKL